MVNGNAQITAPMGKAPLVVLVNPRSGGNQGRHVLRKMQWLLNPWQVFDITHTPPEFVLEVCLMPLGEPDVGFGMDCIDWGGDAGVWAGAARTVAGGGGGRDSGVGSVND